MVKDSSNILSILLLIYRPQAPTCDEYYRPVHYPEIKLFKLHRPEH